MKKIFIFFISLTIILSLILFAVKDKFSINKILEKIKNETDISIELQGKQKWSYYPKITYRNKISLSHKNSNLIIENSSINITKNYWIGSPFLINFKSPSIKYKGLDFRKSIIESEYNNNIDGFIF